MEITGKIIEILPEKSGQSARGPWRKQEYVLETNGQYPKKICFMAWGDKIDEFGIRDGETITAGIDLESREYNGRWYTDVKALKVSKGDASSALALEASRGDYDDTIFNDRAPFDEDIPF